MSSPPLVAEMSVQEKLTPHGQDWQASISTHVCVSKSPAVQVSGPEGRSPSEQWKGHCLPEAVPLQVRLTSKAPRKSPGWFRSRFRPCFIPTMTGASTRGS